MCCYGNSSEKEKVEEAEELLYLQLLVLVLGELAGLLVGRVEVGPAVLGAVPVDVGCKKEDGKLKERRRGSILPSSLHHRVGLAQRWIPWSAGAGSSAGIWTRQGQQTS